MIAPVLGSGDWPAWITRVAKPSLLSEVMCSPALFEGTWAERSSSCKLPSQVIQQVEARDQAVKALRVGNDGDQPAVEHRFELGQGRLGRQGRRRIGHAAGDRRAEP